MQMSLSLKQSAEKLGISFSHYDINGHLIDASPTSVDYFIEQLQFPPNIGQNQPFQNVICAFENEPIHDDLIAFLLLLMLFCVINCLTSKTKFSLKKQFHIQPHFHSLPALPVIYHRLMLFAAQQTRKYNRL